VRADVARDLGRSAKDFRDIVWPRIASWCHGGELVPVEAVTEGKMARALDTLAGIDAWQVVDGQGVRGIASRVQYGLAYDSFTIRVQRPSGAPTEMHKRLAALERPGEGWLLPALTCQAYLDSRGGTLLSVGLVRTRALYRAVQEALRRGAPLHVSPSREKFIALFWTELKESGMQVRFWKKED
jgi:hypothetical protein